jgi:uncharacterized protein YecA (UPF0149 family)
MHKEALELRRETLEFRQRVLPPDHPDIATSMNNLAGSYYHLGNLPMAKGLFQQALSIQEKTLPPNHPHLQNTKAWLKMIATASHRELGMPVAKKVPKIKPNERCPCESGLKFKKCKCPQHHSI